jgi:putative heme-binding domain-containing protein
MQLDTANTKFISIIGTKLCPWASAAFAATLCLTLGNSAFAQRGLKDVPDPDPELERQTFRVADGFEVKLWAADPLLAKPIQINFDPQGRLWVASSSMYPQILPGEVPTDKILILEDTHGVGHADKTTVFADGLFIPTAVIPGDGGAYVANSTELLHLSDSRGGEHADTRRVMLSGFGTEDTHHILHTLRWGPDGCLYFNQSIYIHSHIETPWGPRTLNAGGIWQFRPETMQLEVFARGWVNPWGHEFDRWGQSFVTDGAGGEGINYAFPGACFPTAADAPRVLNGFNPGSPKDCSIEILSGRQMPESWRGNIITNDFRAHRVCRYVVTDDGSAYRSKEMPELIKTNHPAFRPIDCKMGPDGALYIADWYNPIIQHGEVDFRDPRRDHTHGRIWRVTASGRPLVQPPKLVEASDEALLDFLKPPEDWTRAQAKRVIKERGARMLPQLAAWVRRLNPADPDVEHQRLEALWSYQSLRHVEPDLLRSLLHSPEPRVRAAAVRVLGAWHTDIPDALDLLAERVVDDFPRVRLEAVRALSLIPSPESATIALRALDRPMDKFLDFGLWLTARELQTAWLPALRAGTWNFDGNVQHLTFALQAVGSADVVGPLMALLRTGQLGPERTASVMGTVVLLGGSRELGELFDLALAPTTPAEVRIDLLAGLAKTASERRIVPAGDLRRLERLLNGGSRPTIGASRSATSDDGIVPLAARLAGLWRVASLEPRLAELARDDATPEALRQGAFAGLAHMGGARSRQVLEQLSADGRTYNTRILATAALATVDAKAGATRAADILATAPASSDPTPLFSALLDRKDGAAALATALAGKKISADVAKLGLRAVRATASDQTALTSALTAAGGLAVSGPYMLKGAELQKFLTEARTEGDPARGEAIFRSRSQVCLKCHAIGGVGGQVGPDLLSVGASAPMEYLLESITDPSAKIKEGYSTVRAVTDSGQIFRGIKLRQTDKALILRDADNHELTIPLGTIESQSVSTKSLMPVGLADGLTHAELVDLVRFLSELGKVGPYAVGKTPVARRWQTLIVTPAAKTLLRTEAGLQRVVGGDSSLVWESVYSRVAGPLPIDDLPRIAGPDGAAVSFVRCQLDVANAGRIKLKLNSETGLALWIDGRPIQPLAEMDKEFVAGSHPVLFLIRHKERSEPLKLELGDVAGSTARAQFAAGK